MTCAECGADNEPSALTCASCGAMLVGAWTPTEASGTFAAVPGPATSPAEAEPQREPPVASAPPKAPEAVAANETPAPSTAPPSAPDEPADDAATPAATPAAKPAPAAPPPVPAGRPVATTQSDDQSVMPSSYPIETHARDAAAAAPVAGATGATESEDTDEDQGDGEDAPRQMPKRKLTIKSPSRKLVNRARELGRKKQDGEDVPGIPLDVLRADAGSTGAVRRTPAMSGVRAITLNDRIQLYTPQQRLEAGDAALESEELEEALAWYEAALQDRLDDVELLERMVEVAERAEDPVRLSRCLATLAQHAESAKQRADYLFRAATVTREGRGQPKKAAAGYMAAIDADPDRLDAFLAVTEIHTAASDWEALGEAYRFMIQKHSDRRDPNRALLSKLWRKLGSLLAENLGFHADAVTALKAAQTIDPEDVKNPVTLCEIEEAAGNLAGAAEALSDVILLEDDARQQVDDIRKLGLWYLELGRRDAAYCCFRALLYLGEAEDQEREFVERLRPRGLKQIQGHLDSELWNQVYPPRFPHEVARILALIALAVGHRLENDHDHWNVARRDRLDAESPILLMTLLHRVGALFGVEQVPEVFVREEDVEPHGIANGVLDPPGFVVQKSLLSGQRPQQLAFLVARLVALQKSDLYLGAICPINDLEVYVLGASKYVRPDAPIPMSKDIEWIGERLESKLDETQREELFGALGKLIDAGAVVDIEAYLYWLDATANRLALLVADDLDAAEAFVLADTEPVTNASVDERIDLLIRYSVSPPYLALRKALGLSVVGDEPEAGA